MRSIFLILLMLSVVKCFSTTPGDSTKTQAARKIQKFRPHYFALQYAGNIGFISAGAGITTRTDNYELSLIYGYVPPSLAGARIHTITAKNIFPLYRFYLNRKETLIPYGAISISLEVGGRSFFRQPEIMPASYYDFPKSIHLIPALGVKLRHIPNHQRIFRGYDFFIESTSVDAYLWYKLKSNEVEWHQILSVAAGVHLMRR